MPTLITSLAKHQKKLGLNNTEFARLLGISRQLWEMIKRGKRNIGVSLLRGVAQAFPELDGQILDFLRSRSTD